MMLTYLLILLGFIFSCLILTNIPNSFSQLENDERRAEAVDIFCDGNPFCIVFPHYSSPQSFLLTDISLTSELANQTTVDDSGMLLYRNSKLGLEIQYPTWLNKTEQSSGVKFAFPNKSAGAILVNSNVKNSSGDDFDISHVLYLFRSLDNFFVIHNSKSYIMDYPTTEIFFTYSNDTVPYKGIQLWTIKDNEARLFTYFAPADRVFDEYLSTIETMARSIKVS